MSRFYCVAAGNGKSRHSSNKGVTVLAGGWNSTIKVVVMADHEVDRFVIEQVGHDGTRKTLMEGAL